MESIGVKIAVVDDSLIGGLCRWDRDRLAEALDSAPLADEAGDAGPVVIGEPVGEGEQRVTVQHDLTLRHNRLAEP